MRVGATPNIGGTDMFSFQVKEEGSLRQDLEAMTPEIDKGIYYGLTTVAADLPPLLQQHVRDDVYDEYAPDKYLRRSEYPEYGVPIDDIRNMYSKAYPQSRHMVFQYFHKGAHSLYDDNPTYPQYISGDELLDVLESGSGYSWEVGKKNIPPRPYWSNFVTDVVEKGKAERAFGSGFNTSGIGIKAVTDGNIKRDGQETEF